MPKTKLTLKEKAYLEANKNVLKCSQKYDRAIEVLRKRESKLSTTQLEKLIELL